MAPITGISVAPEVVDLNEALVVQEGAKKRRLVKTAEMEVAKVKMANLVAPTDASVGTEQNGKGEEEKPTLVEFVALPKIAGQAMTTQD